MQRQHRFRARRPTATNTTAEITVAAPMPVVGPDDQR